MPSISEGFEQITTQLIKNSRSPREITPENVYQPANMTNRPLIDKIIEKLVLDGSGIVGYEKLKELHDRSQRGASCLVLMEHYSNFDIPGLYYFLESHGTEGAAVANSITSMAGMKLNMESDFIRAFTEAYSRLVIYPSRSLESISDPDERARESRRAKEINNAALRQMVRLKHDGHLILVFPTGTRYRPSNPDTARVLTTVDSYIKSFDYMILIGIAGNVLQVAEGGEMTQDRIVQDAVVYHTGDIIDCRSLRDEIRGHESTGAAAKQAVATEVQERLGLLHRKAEEVRKARLPRQ
ncbi:MAG: 1-acyl-sn-glycerol-3-phosphate acyltransferase [Spirochaetes bacterium]|jgi:glycerol-3-phosphate O-acyltransferase|nr:1-acyl-sn-glycerol-3-phosphate acyltransferase [Spirochaetota bacterium]